VNLGVMYCECGREIYSTGGDLPKVQQFNPLGECVFRICAHGVVVLDKRPKEAPHERAER